MSSPLDFLRRFAGELRAAGIRFAITSGMACGLPPQSEADEPCS